MKKLFLSAVAVAILAIGISIVLPTKTQPQPANAQQAIDKYDGDCTGLETAGRCADKCPEGSYNIGITKNGEAICKLEPTGCPYGDSIPLGAECDKHAPQPEPVQTEAPIMEGK